MKYKLLTLAIITMLCLLLASCGKEAEEPQPVPGAPLEDGTYYAVFKSDSTMFHINEAYKDKGILTVKDGKMTIHVTLVSKSIINLFQGTAEQAKQKGAVLIEPTLDEVTYDDGYTDKVYGFDVPVPRAHV